jgi:hypothetical protein
LKKRFLLRLDPHIYELLERWAADELRSVNGQIEYLLIEALRRSGRLGSRSAGRPPTPAEDPVPSGLAPGPSPSPERPREP